MSENNDHLIKARVQQTKRVYIHNDLSNAAFYFKNEIEKKKIEDNTAGITFNYMALATMIAFTFEAKINFLGWKLIKDWKEFQPFPDKLKQVCEALEMQWNEEVRPYSSLASIKKFRDIVAHGKPQIIEYDEIITAKAGEIDRKVDLSGDWEKACAPEFVMQAYDDLDAVWKEMLKKSGLELWDTLNTGEGGVSFIEKVIPAGEEPPKVSVLGKTAA